MALSIPKENSTAQKAGQVLGKIQELPILSRLGTMLMIATAVAIGLMVFFWSQKPQYSLIYTGVDAKATAEATDLLRAANIPFQIDQATGAISVPEKNIHDARLKLASSGVADSGRMGFEMLEKDPGFGVSQFVENARFQRALETELSRTINTLRPVRDARVHLAIPKPSAFTRQREAASASVVLDLRPGTTLERNQTDAIVHLVSSSIPDLAPERVTVVDQNGRMLTMNDASREELLSATQFEQVRRQESTFTQRVRELLEPVTGPGRVNAEVTVDMDFSVTEEAREAFNNDPAKLRSEQFTESTINNAGPQGIPGATSNTPPGVVPGTPAGAAAGLAPPPANPANPANPATAAQPTESSRSGIRNYEMDRTLQHTRQPGGQIRRVSVAVLVDNIPRVGKDGKTVLQPLTPEEITKVESLVRQAVGFDEKRGDTVSVVNVPFVHEKSPADIPDPWWKNPTLLDLVRPVLGALLVLFLVFGVLRPALRQLIKPEAAAPKGMLAVTAEDNPDGVPLTELSEDTAQISGALGDESAPVKQIAPPLISTESYEDRLQQARDAVRTDSKLVAKVVKDWVEHDGN